MNDPENLNLDPVRAPAITPAISSELSLENLAAEQRTMWKFFHGALAALLLFTGGVNLYLLRQTISIRKDLANYRLRVTQVVAEYQKSGEPALQSFVKNLQVYGQTHPDFIPILVKYNLAPSTSANNRIPPTTPPLQ
ncbi:MAG: hypothetical protein M3Y82_10560 [Verrucomicrobiota bacterium]|nr:hypothetical protein [Verrucomicrobiota bacterium]